MASLRRLLIAALAIGAGAAAAEPGVWLDLHGPPEGLELHGLVDWVEVGGRAGAGNARRQDVLIVIDLSGSTLIASGVDVDGDGSLGHTSSRILRALAGRPGGSRRIYRVEQMCSDLDDTIRAAQLAAARRLVALLDPRFTRVGVLTFHGRAKLASPIGSTPDELHQALDHLESEATSWGGATDFELAIRRAVAAFDASRPSGPGAPERTMLFLSDGVPTAPLSPYIAQLRALEAAKRAAEERVRIHTFAIGPAALEHLGIYFEIADLTGGRLTRVEEPGQILSVLPRIDLAEIALVSMENRTTGEPGRAVRVFPDGTFDGYVPLESGENLIRVTAQARDGRIARVDRRVRYQRREPASPAEVELQRRELSRFMERLQSRSIETELMRNASGTTRSAPLQGKQLDLEVPESPPGGGAGG